MTSDIDAPFVRLLLQPSPLNGPLSPSHLMVDKIASVPRSKLGHRVGRLGDADVARLNSDLKIFLGLA
jgi:mRNA interferase MazF